MPYDKLLDECLSKNVCVHEMDLINKGLYAHDTIGISTRLETTAEKTCTLAEELGHHCTNFGRILNTSKIYNAKQECIARAWAYKNLIPLENLISAYKEHVKNRYELAQYLDVTEEFIEEAIQYYKRKYGLYYQYENYIICFEPFGVMEMFKFE